MKLEIATPVLLLGLLAVTAVFVVTSSRRPAPAKRTTAVPYPPERTAHDRAEARKDRENAEVKERVIDYHANR